MAIRSDLIQFIGSNQQVLGFAGPQTRKLDLKGRTVVPGLIDTHNHLHNAAANDWARKNPEKIESVRRQFEVSGKTFQDVTKGIELVLKENMANPLPGQWAMISLPTGENRTGVGVQYLMAAKAATDEAMTRKELDILAPKLPVVITSSGAPWLLNTAGRNDLLEMYEVEPTDENEKVAITSGTTFGRMMISEKYFDKHMNELADVLQEYLTNMAAGGYTAFSSHIVGLRFMPAYQQLVREERMPIRLGFAHRYCQEMEPNMPSCFLRLGDWARMGNKYFWNLGMTLGASDSGPPRWCTTMEPLPEYRKPGSPWLTQECRTVPGSPYYKAMYAALSARYRYVVNHNAADKSFDVIMDILEKVMEDNPDISLDFMRSLRVSSDHCHFYPRHDQIPRMKKLGMIISCGAGHVNSSSPWLKVFGEDKGDWVAPVKNMLNGGVMVTAEGEGLGSLAGDDPVTPLSGLMNFIPRKNARGELVGARQAVDRIELLKMLTVWSSYYVLKEKELGSLEPGKFADFVVFNKDYFTIPQDELPTVFPLMTVLGAKTIMLREELAKEMGVPPVGPQKKWRFTRNETISDELTGGGEFD